LHYEVNYKNDSFQYSINHRLWTPGVLKDILNQVGFKVIKKVKTFDLKSDAKVDDYKIVFICGI